MSATDDALDVARFCWPSVLAWRIVFDGCVCEDGAQSDAWLNSANRDHIAAAERVLVERGLGREYGLALIDEIDPEFHIACWSWEMISKIATAPLDKRLRAMARVVREKQPKEKHTCARGRG